MQTGSITAATLVSTTQLDDAKNTEFTVAAESSEIQLAMLRYVSDVVEKD